MHLLVVRTLLVLALLILVLEARQLVRLPVLRALNLVCAPVVALASHRARTALRLGVRPLRLLALRLRALPRVLAAGVKVVVLHLHLVSVHAVRDTGLPKKLLQCCRER
eukprot:3703821-Rhodomonas_salina.3